MKFLIIGGGIAGTTAAEEIKKQDKKHEVTIIESEPHPLYSKVLLKNYLKGKLDRDKLFLKPVTWYEKQGIELMVETMVVDFDSKNKYVVLDNGRELPYDKLIIAVGGDPSSILENIRGVAYLRSLDDADHLLKLINETKALSKKQRNVGVLGGGFIGLEFLEIFRSHEFKINFFMRGDHPLMSTLDDVAGEIVNSIIRDNEVNVFTKSSPECLWGEKELEAVQIPGGDKILCFILGVGIGLAPDYSWLSESGLVKENSLHVDEFMQLAPDIYAVGDYVCFNDVVAGRELKQANWFNSLMQGRIAGQNACGKKNEFRLVSSYALNLFGHDIIRIGDTKKQCADEVIGEQGEGYSYLQKFIRDGKLVGAVLIDKNDARKDITKEIESK